MHNTIMKKVYYLLTAAILFTMGRVDAQQYVPTEQKMEMDQAMANAWVIAADEEPIDDLRKEFGRYTKDQLDVKAKKSGRTMMVAKEASIPRIAQKPGDLKAKFYTEDGETMIAIAFMPGYDISLSTAENPDEMENLRKFTKNFLKHYKTEKLTAQIEDQEKRQKKIESNYKKNEREYKKLQKELAKIARKMDDEELEESKKFELKNKKIENEARVMALDEVMANQQEEITEVEDLTQESRSEISHLETLFAEPMASQDAAVAPAKASGDSMVDPEPKPKSTTRPDIDY